MFILSSYQSLNLSLALSLNTFSTSLIQHANKNRLSKHPCVNSFFVQKYLLNFSPTIILSFVLLYFIYFFSNILTAFVNSHSQMLFLNLQTTCTSCFLLHLIVFYYMVQNAYVIFNSSYFSESSLKVQHQPFH